MTQLPDCNKATLEKGRPFCAINFIDIKKPERCTPEWCMGCNPVSYDLDELITECVNAGNLRFMDRIREMGARAQMPGSVIQDSLF